MNSNFLQIVLIVWVALVLVGAVMYRRRKDRAKPARGPVVYPETEERIYSGDEENHG